MSERSNLIYVYDGSFDGLMCCLFDMVYRDERPQCVLCEAEQQATLFEVHRVETDEGRARRVKEAVGKKISHNAMNFVKKAFLTALEGKELMLCDFLQAGFRRGWRIMDELTAEPLATLYAAVRALDNETEHYKGFVRFSELGGVLVSVIEPKNYVLPLLMHHFCSRFPEESLLLYDKTHRMVLLGRGGTGKLAYLEDFEPAAAQAAERELRSLWKTFYDAVAIEARYNPRCRMGHMHKRFWAQMTEFWEENGRRDSASLPGERPALEAAG